MALSAEQEAQRNMLAEIMMGGGGGQNEIEQYYNLTEGMRRDPYGFDPYGGGGSNLGQGPNTGATGPSPTGTGVVPGSIEEAVGPQSQSYTGNEPGGAPPSSVPGTTPVGDPQGQLEGEPGGKGGVVGTVQGEAATQMGTTKGGEMSPGYTATGYPSGVGYPGGINPEGIQPAETIDDPKGGIQVDEFGNPIGGKGDYQGGKQGLLEDPEALNAYAGPMAGPLAGAFAGQAIPGPEWGGWGQYGYGPHGAYSEYGPYSSEFAGSPEAYGFTSEAEQTAWGEAYAAAIEAGYDDPTAADMADQASNSGAYGNEGSVDFGGAIEGWGDSGDIEGSGDEE